MDENSLNRLEDYVFLSSLESPEVFIVERNGEIWKQEGNEAFVVRQRPLKNVLLNWKNLTGPDSKWSWLEGWLPVLQIKGQEAEHELNILTKGDSLWIKNKDSVIAYPDMSVISIENFNNEIHRLKKYWLTWFKKGWMPSGLDQHTDNAWKASFVQALTAYAGKHPRYGVGFYSKKEHDGFFPTTQSMVSALLDYKQQDDAYQLLSYYIKRFVRPDGTLDYYGFSTSELAGLLILSASAIEQNDGKDWFNEHLNYLMPVFYNLLRLHNPVFSRLVHGLILGCPEADQCKEEPGAFFHNNAFAVRAFQEWANAMQQSGNKEAEFEARRNAIELEKSLRSALALFRNKDGTIPSRIDKKEDFENFTASREASYANYRYYPELLETGLLSLDDACSIIRAREEMGGEYNGMTCMAFDNREAVLDDWPLASYARGLMEIEDKARFMNIFKNHMLYHQTQDTYTAYEQVFIKGNPRHAFADWCVPCQLVLPRMLAWSFEYRKWDGTIVKWNGESIART